MKGLSKEALLKIINSVELSFFLEGDLERIFKVYGDDYYISRDTGKWEDFIELVKIYY